MSNRTTDIPGFIADKPVRLLDQARALLRKALWCRQRCSCVEGFHSHKKARLSRACAVHS
jgi:hypothetical protein